MKIINGMRPKIVPGTPLEYKKLMEQCWNADPTERPNINDLKFKIREIRKSYYQKEINQNKNKSMIKKLIEKIGLFTTSEPEINTSLEINDVSSIKSNYTSTSSLFTSKVFTNLPEPRNATEGMYNFYK
ncbi:hypothetical protein C1645_793729 [Glomus cerebriforme]|uniref:Serine-threonine/tyrosine-protein kinase catalytic domain-containing protein n=1 Tax=Glomus cerebriforme TaxID=658196 RepID=A0A397S2U4_9GLOM|nr:hypothetical protein C1645_793729 [Glomus cerebriforme]